MIKHKNKLSFIAIYIYIYETEVNHVESVCIYLNLWRFLFIFLNNVDIVELKMEPLWAPPLFDSLSSDNS